MIREFDQAVLTRDLPEKELMAGDVATVVAMHDSGKGYSLEFFTLAGETLDLATVPADAVRPVGEQDIAHACTSE